VTTLIVREAPQAAADVGHGRAQRLSAAVPDRAVHDRAALRRELRNGEERSEQGEGGGEGEGAPSLHGRGGMWGQTGWMLSKSITKSMPSTGPFTTTIPRFMGSAWSW